MVDQVELVELVEALHEARSRCDADQPPLIRLSNVRITLDEALAKVRTPTTPERSDD